MIIFNKLIPATKNREGITPNIYPITELNQITDPPINDIHLIIIVKFKLIKNSMYLMSKISEKFLINSFTIL